MKKLRILCYGDSNTWGTIPDGTFRHCKLNKRYTYYLEKKLGKNTQVINEGMPSRTTNLDDYKEYKGNRNGSNFFITALITHEPLDYVVVFLGTNDLKNKFNRSVEEIILAIKTNYIDMIKKYSLLGLSKEPKIILITPPVIDDSVSKEYKGETIKSLQFENAFKILARENNCDVISNKILRVGKDGIHLTNASHIRLAEALEKVMRKG